MKRQLGILVLIACMILATVPTALCADDITVTDTNTVLKNPIKLKIGDMLMIKVPNFIGPGPLPNVISITTDPQLQNFANQYLQLSPSYDPTTDTAFDQVTAIAPGITKFTYIFKDGNSFIFKVRVVNEDDQGENEQ